MIHSLLSLVLVFSMLSFVAYTVWLRARYGTGGGGHLSDWLGDAPAWHYSVFIWGLAGLLGLAFATVATQPGDAPVVCKLFPSYAECHARDD